jgi:SAM-dependent methyltransferase
MALTQRTHEIVRAHFLHRPKTSALDATCGNGFDTQFLVQLGFNQVFAFDIQSEALKNAQARLSADERKSVTFVLDGHQNLSKHLTEPLDCIMFNLGYLPGADKHVTTLPDTSLAALQQSVALLSDHGLISIMCYPGHPAGAAEMASLLEWFATISDTWQLHTHLASAPKPTAPILYTLRPQHNSMRESK